MLISIFFPLAASVILTTAIEWAIEPDGSDYSPNIMEQPELEEGDGC